MKYNIFTVANEGYFPFLKMFVGSIFDKLSLDNIEEIIVADTGLSETSLQHLDCFPKVRVFDTKIKTKYSEIHDDCWKENVYSKARLLLETIQRASEFVPTIMIDCDCIVIEDFFDLLEGDGDVISCLRNQAGRPPDHAASSSHIGSFFGVLEKERGIKFLQEWVKNIDFFCNEGAGSLNRNGHPIAAAKESPALSKTICELNELINIQDLDERIIANIEETPPSFARMYHLKSDWQFMTIDARVNQPRAAFWAKRYLKGGPKLR